MAQYINKDAVVAEIERLQDSIQATAIDDRISKEQAEAYKVCVKLRSFVEDTLEVKEVDLEKEVIDWWNTYYSNIDYTFEEYNGHYLKNSTIINVAKHFYELGLNSKKEE